jgi:hypothetical protein
MKLLFGLAACLVLVLGFSSDGQAGGFRGGFSASSTGALVHPYTSVSGSVFTINKNETVGAQTVNSSTNPGVTTVVNNGTINGGSSTALTTGPAVTNVTNNGAINSSTGGVSMTGTSSLSLTNNGTIIVSNTTVSANTAISSAHGITLSVGP